MSIFEMVVLSLNGLLAYNSLAYNLFAYIFMFPNVETTNIVQIQKLEGVAFQKIWSKKRETEREKNTICQHFSRVVHSKTSFRSTVCDRRIESNVEKLTSILKVFSSAFISEAQFGSTTTRLSCICYLAKIYVWGQQNPYATHWTHDIIMGDPIYTFWPRSSMLRFQLNKM